MPRAYETALKLKVADRSKRHGVETVGRLGFASGSSAVWACATPDPTNTFRIRYRKIAARFISHLPVGGPLVALDCNCRMPNRCAQVLISSIKGEVKKKHVCCGRSFSCFPAHVIERELFRPAAPWARCAGRFGPVVRVSSTSGFRRLSQRSHQF